MVVRTLAKILKQKTYYILLCAILHTFMRHITYSAFVAKVGREGVGQEIYIENKLLSPADTQYQNHYKHFSKLKMTLFLPNSFAFFHL